MILVFKRVQVKQWKEGWLWLSLFFLYFCYKLLSMTIIIQDSEGTTVSLTNEDGELYLTIGEESTVMIEDIDKFIKAINFVMDKSSNL